MAEPTARPFHIGSAARHPRTGDDIEIRFVESHSAFGYISNSGQGLYFDSYPVEDLVHVSDGAPLGDFEPLPRDAVDDAIYNSWDRDYYDVDSVTKALNALIRGDDA